MRAHHCEQSSCIRVDVRVYSVCAALHSTRLKDEARDNETALCPPTLSTCCHVSRVGMACSTIPGCVRLLPVLPTMGRIRQGRARQIRVCVLFLVHALANKYSYILSFRVFLNFTCENISTLVENYKSWVFSRHNVLTSCSWPLQHLWSLSSPRSSDSNRSFPIQRPNPATTLLHHHWCAASHRLWS